MASTSEKFDAAVSVIRNLPKNGPFQPSYEMMKRFYGLFKQATEGPCTQAKPAFWNVVQAAKWQAWSSLGNLDGEDAKALYVDELLKIVLANSNARDVAHLMQIVETMPQSDDVLEFLKVMGPFFELVSEKLEVVSAPAKVTKANGITNGAVQMRENGIGGKGDHSDGPGDENVLGMDIPNGHLENGHSIDRGMGDEGEIRHRQMYRVEGEGEVEDDREDDATEIDFSKIKSSEQEDDSVNLSHPIYISKSQLEAAQLHLNGSSDSESEGEEFCDSVDQPLLDKTQVGLSSPDGPFQPSEHVERLSSTPFSAENVVVTEAEVHNNIDAVIVPKYTSSSSTTPPEPLPSKRGGGEVTSGSKGQQGKGNSRYTSDQPGKTYSKGGLQRGGSQQLPASGGGGGGGSGAGGRTPGAGPRYPLPDDVTEQITVSLERLQRDMNSVLVRLNTLETIAISRHQIETQEAYMRDGQSQVRRPNTRSPWWWPFPSMPTKTVLILLVWPFIVHWIINFLARQRRPRRR